MTRRIPLLVPFVVLALLSACEKDARNDAIIFLDRVQRIDLDDPVADRRRLVDSLASLPLEAEQVRAARDACVEAHQTILESEEIMQEARDALARFESEEDLPITERQRLDQDIRRSRELIDRSRTMFSECHRRTRDLEVRYRSRRARGD